MKKFIPLIALMFVGCNESIAGNEVKIIHIGCFEKGTIGEGTPFTMMETTNQHIRFKRVGVWGKEGDTFVWREYP